MDNQQWISDLEGTGFLQEMLETLIQRGLGVLPAREVAISTLELILRHHPEWKNSPPPDYELARLFKISPRRLRGYLDDINFRNQEIDNVELDARLRETLRNAERVADDKWVMFEIQDALLRSYAEQKVRASFGIVESGLSSGIIKISGVQFVRLCVSVLSDDEAKVILAALGEEQGALNGESGGKEKKLGVRVWEAFALSASKHAGKKVVDLGFLLASGGLSELSSISEVLRSLLGRGDSDASDVG